MIRIIKNIIILRRAIKDPSILNMDRLFQYFKGLTKLERKYALKAVLAYRKVYPYQVQDYSEAKDLYEDYFKLKNSIQSLEELQERFEEQEELYLIKFRQEAPVKGKRWCEYYVNYGYDEEEEKVYKVHDISKGPLGEVRIVVDYNISVLEEDLTAFKYATQKEIKDFKRAEIRKASIQQKIKQKEEEIKELEKLIND